MGWGDYCMAAKAFGADVTGVELSQEMHNRGRQLGINVVEAPHGIYDAILLHQVLEHLPEPVATLTLLNEHLADDGVIFAATPNGAPVYRCAGSFSERNFLANQKIVAPPEHLNT